MESADPLGRIFKEVGSEAPFFALVDHFYAGVEKDLLLRPMYPEDLELPKKHLALFLIQRMGGRSTYSQERGHPRMRARHLPFKIGQAERDAWMRNMTLALNAVPELSQYKEELLAFFDDFSLFMINQPA
ncbi:MAG TPA: globin [Oculatellaceae cyanobacterium]